MNPLQPSSSPNPVSPPPTWINLSKIDQAITHLREQIPNLREAEISARQLSGRDFSAKAAAALERNEDSATTKIVESFALYNASMATISQALTAIEERRDKEMTPHLMSRLKAIEAQIDKFEAELNGAIQADSHLTKEERSAILAPKKEAIYELRRQLAHIRVLDKYDKDVSQFRTTQQLTLPLAGVVPDLVTSLNTQDRTTELKLSEEDSKQHKLRRTIEVEGKKYILPSQFVKDVPRNFVQINGSFFTSSVEVFQELRKKGIPDDKIIRILYLATQTSGSFLLAKSDALYTTLCPNVPLGTALTNKRANIVVETSWFSKPKISVEVSGDYGMKALDDPEKDPFAKGTITLRIVDLENWHHDVIDAEINIRQTYFTKPETA